MYVPIYSIYKYYIQTVNLQRAQAHTRRRNCPEGGLSQRARVRRHCGPLCSTLVAARSSSICIAVEFTTEKILRPWPRQARQLIPRWGTVAHLGNQGCCVHIHTENLSNRMWVYLGLRIYIYIYIYRERERDLYTDIPIHRHLASFSGRGRQLCVRRLR